MMVIKLHQVFISVQSLILAKREDNQKLSKILKNKFNLDSGIHKHTNGHRLYIFSSSKDRLLELIKPYLIHHFYYKFELEN